MPEFRKWMGRCASVAGAALLGVAATTLIVPSGYAGDDIKLVPIKVTPGIISTAKMTRFDPAVHGFRFTNQFKHVLGVFDITTSGYCGGMAYSALDYFKSGIATPKQSYVPVAGTALENYILSRQMKSLEAHMDKWIELHGNPFGARNSEFFNWGLQGTGGGRLQELRAKIDAGNPVPLGLKSMSADPSADHVVLAYGYDMGRYKGDLGTNKEDLKIFIYEPNYGAQKITLVPNITKQAWCYVEDPEQCWRSYFVQQNYAQMSPPRVPDRPVEMKLTFHTGGDDLRGGGDNVSVRINLTDGRVINATNVNRSQRWMNNTRNTVGISLPDTVRAGQVRDITIITGFRGGFDGDNWNMDRVDASLDVGGVSAERCNNPGTRFTGDVHNLVVRPSC